MVVRFKNYKDRVRIADLVARYSEKPWTSLICVVTEFKIAITPESADKKHKNLTGTLERRTFVMYSLGCDEFSSAER